MTERARQNLEFEFGGKKYTIRPTWALLIDIEVATNQACRALGMKFLSMTASLSEITIVTQVLLKDQKDAPQKPEEIGEIIMDDGFTELLGPYGMFLTSAQRGHKIAIQEAAEAAEAARKAKENPPTGG